MSVMVGWEETLVQELECYWAKRATDLIQKTSYWIFGTLDYKRMWNSLSTFNAHYQHTEILN